ncbi:hypothetical protein [Bacteroides acidifaciens]|uniref:hypothetical protein n=1 Tax=Bacteroides acidifaciens TaxID=85831 RepID=UPI0026291C6E|nr:hypothetical protein [Bacteroides acidifaciens]
MKKKQYTNRAAMLRMLRFRESRTGRCSRTLIGVTTRLVQDKDGLVYKVVDEPDEVRTGAKILLAAIK